MRKVILPLLLVFCSFFGISQEKNEISYKIVSNPNNSEVQQYVDAIDHSNFECFRYETKSRFLTFKSGVVVELFSHNKVVEAGIDQKNNCFLADTVTANEYELELVGAQIAIKAPYDKGLKRVNHDK